MSLEAIGSSPGWWPVVVVGDIEADRHWVRTPIGVIRADQAQWSVSDQVHTQRYIPVWAVLMAIVFALLCLLGLLFLLVRDERRYYEVTVTVTGGGFAHTTRVGAHDPRVVGDIRGRVAHARALAAAA